jgi:hypothetical protein
MPSDCEHHRRHAGSTSNSFTATKRILYRTWLPVSCALGIIVLCSFGTITETEHLIVDIPDEEGIRTRSSTDRHSISPLKGIRVVLVEDETSGNADGSEIEFVYETPEALNPAVHTKAILFMAHGCSHAATDMFDRSEACTQCIGLPIEKRIVRAALAKGFAVLAVTSQDRYRSASITPLETISA